ncbi:hypothetical protein ZIOFF_057427 [Zingiber officinale]|uniref:Uncharacterized protein n=1 Tax=Zingiber officinale TaxID=94328 RepID=A0A8J5F6Z7_ZINOF|nr:hypothetical protein ZIOFF_057427 [Zingiber officinale]
MASPPSYLIPLALFISFILLFASASSNEERKVYIVYMGAQPSSQYPTPEHHLNLLKEILVNNYQKSFSGFAAKLSTDEAAKLSGDYTLDEPSPRDFEGHGSHTSSTAAGRSVSHASLYDLAQGTARGAVPSARLAMYKVCWTFGCTEVDILAAFDDAISDGVDIISASIGSLFQMDYFVDSLAIGSFHAMMNGILTSTAAGNMGPSHNTVTNVAPWLMSVAASSIDRHIIGRVVTGDNVSTLVSFEGILCSDDTALDYSYSYPRPTILLSTADGLKLKHYINNTENPVANIHKSEQVFDPRAPLVASFSSRGPNLVTRDILKPDIIAPGIDILAAWSKAVPVSGITGDPRFVEFNIISGTSMACPHVTGAAAYVKSFHPNWSPAAIMSALMTTAKPMHPSDKQDQLSYGAGQLNPVKAVDPGLVYDAGESDYVQMLCNTGYNETLIKIITGHNSSCPAKAKGNARDLNYPTMGLYVKDGKTFAAKFLRTVTNVGSVGKYKAKVTADSKLNVTVNPSELEFSELNEKRQFTVSVSGVPLPGNSTAPATVIWSNGKHQVRSVMVVYTDFSTSYD